MPCYHPLIRIPSFFNAENKLQYRFESLNEYNQDKLNQYYKINHPEHGIIEARSCLVGCGQCIGCRLKKSAEWATRCMLELKYHKSAYFVTLTYDDYHLEHPLVYAKNRSTVPDVAPLTYYDDPNDFGNSLPAYSLRPRHLTNFWKRLRKQFPDCDIRYYSCGEYGSKTRRPHYHAIIFGLELDDLVFYKTNELGQKMYNSPSFQKVWSDDVGPIGFAVVGDVTWESCAYVARYVTKKLNGSFKYVYDTFNIEPEFTRMSNHGGIGKQYFLDHCDGIYKYDQINIATLKGGRKVKPPAYYDRLFDEVNPNKMLEVKCNREEVAEALSAAKMASTSLSYFEMLAVEERNRKEKVKVLQRKEC